MADSKRAVNTLGFSLIELLVVMAIIAIIGGAIIANFRGSAKTVSAQKQIASVVLADIRQMQSLALSGSLYKDIIVCGFGVHYVDSQSYLLFAALPDAAGGCASSHKYSEIRDYVIESKKISNSNIEFAEMFPDVFFEPPRPTVYINASKDIKMKALVKFKSRGSVCGTDKCTVITIETSGRMTMEVN